MYIGPAELRSGGIGSGRTRGYLKSVIAWIHAIGFLCLLVHMHFKSVFPWIEDPCTVAGKTKGDSFFVAVEKVSGER